MKAEDSVLKVSANMIGVLRFHDVDDLGLPASTPKRAVRLMQGHMNRVDEIALNLALRLKALHDAHMKQVTALQAERDALRAALVDMKENGLRFDLNPCHDMTDQKSSEQFWHSYARRMDASIRERAQTALGEPSNG